jgi:hypothetical protein
MNVAAPTPAQPVTCARHATGAKPAAQRPRGIRRRHTPRCPNHVERAGAFELSATDAERLLIGALCSLRS